MINVLRNKSTQAASPLIEYFTSDFAKKVRKFHYTIPGFNITPLVELEDNNAKLGLRQLWIKDESRRMGLKAFKVLGASYAITNFLYDELGLRKDDISFLKLLNTDLSKYSFVTATDGNHGRGVAWTSNKLGCKSYVFMPNTSSEERIGNIREFATDVNVVNGNYDFASKKAEEFAAKIEAVLIQDSSWEGYEDIPLLIMQGYLTLIDEIYEQLGGENFTHIFLHCGVGSMPAAIEAYLVNKFGNDKPKTIIVEPDKADCFYQSIAINDGKPHTVAGKLDSIMAGLSCGTPSKLAWDIISSNSNYFISCNDEIAKIGMRELAKLNIVSGESGGVSYGILKYASEKNHSILDKLEIDKNSKIMIISTEGDTDPTFYQKVLSNSD